MITTLTLKHLLNNTDVIHKYYNDLNIIKL